MDLQTFSRLFAGVINMNLNGKVFDEILSTQLKPKNEKKKKKYVGDKIRDEVINTCLWNR